MVWLTLLAALFAAILAGSFFAFSAFVMPALRRLPAGDAVRAVQSINEVAPRSLLMLPLLGSPVGSLIVGGYALVRPEVPQRWWLVAGAVAGLAAFVVTIAGNVPLNNKLARADPSDPGTPAEWTRFLSGWLRWNQIRTLAAAASSVVLVAGLLLDR